MKLGREAGGRSGKSWEVGKDMIKIYRMKFSKSKQTNKQTNGCLHEHGWEIIYGSVDTLSVAPPLSATIVKGVVPREPCSS